MKTNLAVLIALFEVLTPEEQNLFTALMPCFYDVKRNEKEFKKIRENTAIPVTEFEEISSDERELFTDALPRFEWVKNSRPDIWKIYREAANEAVTAYETGDVHRVDTATIKVSAALRLLVDAWEQRIVAMLTCGECGNSLQLIKMEYGESSAVLTVELCECNKAKQIERSRP